MKKKSFLVLTSGKFLETLGSGIGTGSIICLSFSLSNRVKGNFGPLLSLLGSSFFVLNLGSCPIQHVTYLKLRRIYSWYRLRKCTKWHIFHSKWWKLSFWVKTVFILSVAQLVPTVIFFSAWVKSYVKWDNSRNSTQKMRT